MISSQIYIAISIVALAIIALLLFFVKKGKKDRGITPLAGLAFAFILAGLFFSDERIVGYSLIGAGLFLAFIDMFRKSKSR
jgi:hypothetical protein